MYPQTQRPNFFPSTVRRLAGWMAFLILVSMGTSCSKAPFFPITSGRSVVPTATNASFVGVTLTNESGFTVVYLACPPEVRSNGIWSGPSVPPRQRLSKLPAGQSGVVVVPAASTNQNTRVPILWGYDDYQPGANRLQQLGEDLVGRLRGHGGRGMLHTNYLIDLKP